MSEEKKYAGKYDSVEELEAGYRNAQKYISSRKAAKDMTDFDLYNLNKEVYGDLMKQESGIEGDLKEASDQVRKELGLPAKLVDRIIAAGANHYKSNIEKARKNEISSFLKEGENESNLKRALKDKSEEERKKFEERLNQGVVSVFELNHVVSSGAEPASENSGAANNDGSDVDPAQRYIDIIESGIKHRPGDPNHNAAMLELKQLERKLGIE